MTHPKKPESKQPTMLKDQKKQTSFFHRKASTKFLHSIPQESKSEFKEFKESEESKEDIIKSEQKAAEQKHQQEEALAAARAKEAKNKEEAEILKPLYALAKKMIVGRGFCPESKEQKDHLAQELQRELKEDNMVSALNLLRQKRNFKKPTPQFKAYSYDQALYGCSLLRLSKDNHPSSLPKPSKELYIIRDNELWFWDPEKQDKAKELKPKFGSSDAQKKYDDQFKKLKVGELRDAKVQDLEAIKSAVSGLLPSSENAAISPGVLLCSNAELKPMEYIDTASQTLRLQSLINRALRTRGLLKVRLTGHYVVQENGELQPVLVYHANSGKDKKSVRFLERLILDDVTGALLAHHTSVQVLAQTHQRAYKMNDANDGLAIKDDHLVWAPGFRKMLNGFSHKISQLSTSRQVSLKPRGRYEEIDGVFVYKGSDSASCAQPEKDGLDDLAANIQTWVFTRKEEGDPDNALQLDSIPTPSKDCIIDYRKQGNRYAPHEPVSQKTDDSTWHAFSGLSRRGKKAFKRPEEVYNADALDEVKQEVFKEGSKPIYEVKPKVLDAQHRAAVKLYMRAANEFLAIPTGSVPAEFLDSLDELRWLMNKLQTRTSRRLDDEVDAYHQLFEVGGVESKAFNPKWEIAFTTALNKVIKTQVNFDSNNEVATAWLQALKDWSKSQEFEIFTHNLKLRPALESKSEHAKLDATQYRLGMSAEELRKLSSAETQGGGCNPLQMLFGAFNCEIMGGWCSVNGSTTETNQSMADHLTFEEAQLITEGMFSDKNALMAIFDGANTERSDEELKEEQELGLEPPSKSLPQMIKTLFGFLNFCDELQPAIELAPKVPISPVAHPKRAAATLLAPPKIPELPAKINEAIKRIVAPHRGSSTIVKLGDEDTIEEFMESPDKPSKPYYIVQDDRIFFCDPKTNPLLKELTCIEAKLCARLQQHFSKFESFKQLKERGEDLRLAQEPDLFCIEDCTGHKEYEHWPHEDRALFVLFTHLVEQMNKVGYWHLNASNPKLKAVIDEAIEACLHIHEVKTVYALHNRSGAVQKDDTIDWAGLDKKMLAAQETVKKCSQKMQKRNGCDTLKIVLLALGGICLLAGGIALLAVSFGGLAPLSAGMASCGIYLTVAQLSLGAQILGGISFLGSAVCGIGSGVSFFKNKPSPAAVDFAKQMAVDIEALSPVAESV